MPSGDAANGDGADRARIGRIKRRWRVVGLTLALFVGALLFVDILAPGYDAEPPPFAEKLETPSVGADKELIANLEAQVIEAEARVKEYRVRSSAAAISVQQHGELNDQLSSARAAQADAQAKASLLREVLRQGRFDEISDVAQNETTRRIEKRRLALQAQLARESRTFLWKHPRIKDLKAQLADLDVEWRAAVGGAAGAFENETRLASGRVNALQRMLEDQSRVARDADAQEANLRALAGAAKLLREQLERKTAKDRAALQREGETPTDGGVIQRALTLQFPLSPQKLAIAVLAILGAFILAIGAIVSSELLSGAPENVIPAAQRPAELNSEATSPGDVIDTRASARSSDSFPEEVAAPDVHFTRVACVKVLVASCEANEKTQDAAIALGRNLARRGRALLIAADRALTRIDALALADGALKGLADLLAGEISYSDAIYRDAGSHLHVIPGGVGDSEESKDASEGEDELQPVINALAHAYDFLVVAGSPETARRLAPHIDLAFVIGGAEAESLRAELAGAGADAFLLEEGVNADDLVAAE